MSFFGLKTKTNVVERSKSYHLLLKSSLHSLKKLSINKNNYSLRFVNAWKMTHCRYILTTWLIAFYCIGFSFQIFKCNYMRVLKSFLRIIFVNNTWCWMKLHTYTKDKKYSVFIKIYRLLLLKWKYFAKRFFVFSDFRWELSCFKISVFTFLSVSLLYITVTKECSKNEEVATKRTRFNKNL